MVGDSNGHQEASSSKSVEGGGQRKRNGNSSLAKAGNTKSSADPKSTVLLASEKGRLDAAQSRALMDLISRSSVLGFDSRRLIFVMVTNIALEDSKEKRADLVSQLREFLEGDGLAKDLVPALAGAFALS